MAQSNRDILHTFGRVTEGRYSDGISFEPLSSDLQLQAQGQAGLKLQVPVVRPMHSKELLGARSIRISSMAKTEAQLKEQAKVEDT